MTDLFRTVATIACTVVVSATCLFGALAPAHIAAVPAQTQNVA